MTVAAAARVVHGTEPLVYTGTYDEAKKTYEFRGAMSMGPAGEWKSRDVLVVNGPDSMTYTGHGDMGQGESKMMELVYTRK